MKEKYDFSLEPGKMKTKCRDYKDKESVISVVIPFYNDKDYIEQSVNSVLNQTFPYYEILIIDDGSKDEESLKKLDEVAKQDTRIKVFHKENEPCRNRITCRNLLHLLWIYVWKCVWI